MDLPEIIRTDRLEAMPDGRLAYRLKTPWRDGTTHVVMERHELLDRLLLLTRHLDTLLGVTDPGMCLLA